MSHKGHGRHPSAKVVFIKPDTTLGALEESSFQDLTTFAKKAVEKIYEIQEITHIVYNTIIKTHNTTEDLIDDIRDRNKSHLINIISKAIETNESITYEWNDEDNNNLYEILMKIYEDNINNLDKYDKEIFEINPLIEQIIDIAKELNKTMR
eukprot:390000_1